MSQQLRDRPFKSAMFSRRLRKVALHKHQRDQLTVEEYDQFCSKTQDPRTLQRICDMSETGEWGESVWDIEWWGWIIENWSQIRKFINELDRVPHNPNVAYDRAPRRRGRRHKLPSYHDDAGYQADKELTLRELDETRTFYRFQ